MTALLELTDVHVRIPSERGVVHAVDGVSLRIDPGEVVALVGESGCGKSTLANAILGLTPTGSEVDGSIRYRDTELTDLGAEDYRRLRGAKISMIFQDPSASLDPTAAIGAQVADTIRLHQRVGRREANARAVDMLARVGIPDPTTRFGDPPHRFSGGMKQRVVIAAALANDPELLVADEPTTALDVTVQAQILRLLDDIAGHGSRAVLLITHDLGVVASIATRVVVMYAGRVAEVGPVDNVLTAPMHPYTQALLAARPSSSHGTGDLPTIPGRVPDMTDPVPGCAFAERCPAVHERCATRPPLFPVQGAFAACWLHQPALVTS